MRVLSLPVRRQRTVTDPGIPCREENLGVHELTWRIPVEQAALVLIDCWDEHPLVSHLERSGRIMRQVILPTVEACRAAGVTIVHAPSPGIARKYPQWVAYAGDSELPEPDSGSSRSSSWPPSAFRLRTGEYAAFRLPEERLLTHWHRTRERYRGIDSCLGPAPGDFVVATGEQLHRLCRHRRILHLFYAGFAANMCVLYRDYGVRAMSDRGYNVILLRDATTAIETAETYPDMTLTRAAIVAVEQLFGVTTTSDDLRRACRNISDDGCVG